MSTPERLSERQLRVLEAVIETYIETAEPAGSRTIARRYGLGVSPATIRTIMGELEAGGYLFHPHTSAGRIPTDRAYRVYVDSLMHLSPPSREAQQTLQAELPTSRSAMDQLLRRAAQVLGVLTQELGVAAAPTFDHVVLDRLELVQVSSDRLLMMLTLRTGAVRTIFVEVRGAIAPEALQRVAQVLNERLAGLSVEQIRASLGERLRDAGGTPEGQELLNIFVAEREELFDLSTESQEVVLGSAQMLADQPEFASNVRMRELLHLTERRDLLREALRTRREGLTITIGGENADPRLGGFTLVTASYRTGDLRGVIGVLGPTRMPYEKIIGLVEHTSLLVEGLLT
ncbi:MAG TPA: heat-inducible transcriptional repressor HrcA [Gemmatimonadales bacterium]|nr:heat-inducible transcriptional repressor HrcA [Gemmatimonadales bacterium]